jgi:hypothetical protein
MSGVAIVRKALSQGCEDVEAQLSAPNSLQPNASLRVFRSLMFIRAPLHLRA